MDVFEKTLPMSTYLVAFAVTNFESINQTSEKYNIQIEVVARPEAIMNGEGDYGLSEAAKIIDYFVDYFNISYPLAKSGKILEASGSGSDLTCEMTLYHRSSKSN